MHHRTPPPQAPHGASCCTQAACPREPPIKVCGNSFPLVRGVHSNPLQSRCSSMDGAPSWVMSRTGVVIGVDSPRDHSTIMEVLAAFIRDHSREPWPPAEAGADP